MVIPLGPKLYFPNFVFTLVRSGKERTPNTAVFRVPRILNKLDIKQYLEGLYGLKVNSIRTTNFLSKTTRQGKRYIPNKKNAVVKLAEPFKYPEPTDLSLLKYPLPPSNVYRKIHSRR